MLEGQKLRTNYSKESEMQEISTKLTIRQTLTVDSMRVMEADLKLEIITAEGNMPDASINKI